MSGDAKAAPSLDVLLGRGRATCPACERKGLGYAAHPHAFGWKDYDRASCRYCRKTFKIRRAPPAEVAA